MKWLQNYKKNVKLQKPFTLVISPERNIFSWSELRLYQDVFLFLTWKEILIRYKQTILGVAWVILRPLITVIIFSIIFGKLAGFSSQGIPYPLLVFVGLLPWQFFADSFLYGSGSLIANVELVSKVYFPRIIIPLSSIMCFVLDFGIFFLILFPIMIYYYFIPSFFIFLIPLLFLWTLVLTIGATLFVAALNVKYRDFKHVVPYLIQVGLYISPIGFNTNIIPSKWHMLYSLNPMVGIIDGFRWALLGDVLYLPSIAISIGVTIVVLIIGVTYFAKVELTFADVI